MTGVPCNLCGYVHTPASASIAVGRFGGVVIFVAKGVPGAALRSTRVEAEVDYCRDKQQRRPAAPPVAPVVRAAPAEPVEKPAPAPFPAARMEEAARLKAWADFLSQAAFSLNVWRLDESVRAALPDPRQWLGDCRDELARMIGGAA